MIQDHQDSRPARRYRKAKDVSGKGLDPKQIPALKALEVSHGLMEVEGRLEWGTLGRRNWQQQFMDRQFQTG